MSNGAARRSSEKDREGERDRKRERARRVVRVAAALECVRTNYTLDRALQVLLLPLMGVGGVEGGSCHKRLFVTATEWECRSFQPTDFHLPLLSPAISAM